MARHLLDANGDVIKYFHESGDNGDAIIETVQDVEPVLEQNKYMRNNTDGYGESGSMKHVASIPMVVYAEWCEEFQREHGVSLMAVQGPAKQTFLKRKLNDYNNAYLRTSKGQV